MVGDEVETGAVPLGQAYPAPAGGTEPREGVAPVACGPSLELARHDEPVVGVERDEPLVEGAVVKTVEQKAILHVDALGERVGVAPWFDVAGDEKTLDPEARNAAFPLVEL